MLVSNVAGWLYLRSKDALDPYEIRVHVPAGVPGSETYLGGITNGLTSSFGGFGAGGSAGDAAPCGGGGGAGYLVRVLLLNF